MAREFGFWNEWRGHFDGTPVFMSRTLFRCKGWKIALHKFVEPDMPDCYHTHPATAWRFILWGGYQERIIYEDVGSGFVVYRNVYPFTISKVKPELAHRIHKFLTWKSSWTLWVRGPITDEVRLIGSGWH